ncbi:MAG: hypothetical protein ISP01_08860 [Methanobrevibacter arboriphilus]|jgi:hypothetical protein|uniref:Uncharacterized protein n=2 Tax=Methanobrevibacter arboriphilus TaxID=39441 RepID=A0ACA8R158_METAZ|nr:hypothetical protein [Methanobrevibacter arboriphilus]MBF4469498.1 hypothetical protein [Methanobrevibacter arboriphilus]MCC7562593.1 hypothetical protein [Methanobrevibacter arboriphilus]BBL61251.1 hypothetical protein MarbSA_02910 [Methanobrevibacter arboriphilus]GLI11416.1 hypothetical protein MARBORIA2_05060 [Methanobrevibacter arboriphilus]
MATGTLIFSHIIPAVLGFFGVLLLISGIMDNEKKITIIGALLFIIAAISPFIVLHFVI